MSTQLNAKYFQVFQAELMLVIVKDMEGTPHQLDSSINRKKFDLSELVKAINRKDRSAFEALYDATVNTIYSLALRFMRQHETAEEVVADVYLQVWRKSTQYDPARANVMAWLTVLCRSRALDLLRKNKKLASEVDAENIDVLQVPQEPLDMLETVEQNSALYQALQTLDVQQRQLLALAYFRGYSHSQLAKIMGMPIGTVKTQLRRSIEMLHGLMSKNSNSTTGRH